MRTYHFSVFPQTDVSVLRIHEDGGTGFSQERSLPSAQVDAFVEEVDALYSAIGLDLRDLGKRLYDWLDGDERWMARLHDGATGGRALHIDVGERMRHLPWELLFRDGWLCGDVARPFTPVRRVEKTSRTVGPANRPLRVLFMASSPEDVMPVLQYEREEAMILEATVRRPTQLVVEESGSLEGLGETVLSYGQGHFDVLHLTGHATLKDGVPVFLVENELGFVHHATAAEIAEAMQGIWPRLVFLSGCRTGEAPKSGVFASLAESLVEAGAPAVLGWALPVLDRAASLAAAELYEHLASGIRLDEAVARTRRKLLEAEEDDWHLLRLYADTTPLDALVTPLRTRGREPLPPVRRAETQFLDAGRHVGKVQVCSREAFVGRRRIIQRSLRALRSYPGEDGYAEGVLLHGMGGLGKSSLAARLCERMVDHPRLVWVGLIDEAALLRTMAEGIPSAEVGALLNEPGLSLRQRLVRVLTGPLASSPHLFVFDDFEHNLERGPDKEPILGASDRAKLLEEPGRLLAAVLDALHETSSASRVIVTCRYDFSYSSTGSLRVEPLGGFSGADLTKKVSQLEGFRRVRQTNANLSDRALKAGAGNPRLLEWLDKAFRNAEIDEEKLVEAIEKVAEEFREDVLLRVILAQQEPDFRRMLALLSVYELPVGREAVDVVAGDLVDRFLGRAVALGIVETAQTPGTDEECSYLVSLVASQEVASDIRKEERVEAYSAAAKHLHEQWMSGGLGEKEEMELHKLAMAGGQQRIAIDLANQITARWYRQTRFREAERFARQTLYIYQDFSLLQKLAATEQVLGKTLQAREHYESALEQCPTPEETQDESVLASRAAIVHNLASLYAIADDPRRALDLLQQSLELSERIGNTRGKAATLHAMAGIIAQQGNPRRALDLLQQSLELNEQIGNVHETAATLLYMASIHAQQGELRRALDLLQQSLNLANETSNLHVKAAALHEMAGILARQDDMSRALDFFQQSLELREHIGDVPGKAATLHQMASIVAEQGDSRRALDLFRESLFLEEQIGHMRGKAITLASIASLLKGEGEVEQARKYFLEALDILIPRNSWVDACYILANLGTLDERNRSVHHAQALWLAAHLNAPILIVKVAESLCDTEHWEAGITFDIALGTAALTAVRGEHYPMYAEQRNSALRLVERCGLARNIAESDLQGWFDEQFTDPPTLLARMDAALVGLVPEDGWAFDRSLFPEEPVI